MVFCKKISFLLTMMLFVNCDPQKTANSNSQRTVILQNNDSIKVPVLKINKKDFSPVKDLHLKHSVGGAAIEEETLIEVKYDDTYLEIKFECRNNPRMDQNYYTEDNTSIYNQEVFEIFISKDKEAPEDYLEIEINPNNALFLGKIKNTFKTDPSVKLDFIDTKTSGVVHSIQKDVKNETWSGHLKLPLSLLNYPNTADGNTYRLNFYRIISNKDQEDIKWKNNAQNSTYACWSSTLAPRPNFHRPEYFGFLILE